MCYIKLLSESAVKRITGPKINCPGCNHPMKVHNNEAECLVCEKKWNLDQSNDNYDIIDEKTEFRYK